MLTLEKGLSHALQLLQVAKISINEKRTYFPFQWYPLSSIKIIRTLLILSLNFVYFRRFPAFFICRGITSKQNVKRYVSTSEVYTQIMPANVTRFDQSVSSNCVKTGLSCLKYNFNLAIWQNNTTVIHLSWWRKEISLDSINCELCWYYNLESGKK